MDVKRIAVALAVVALVVAGCTAVTEPGSTTSTTSTTTATSTSTSTTSSSTSTTTVITTLSDLEIGRQALVALAASTGDDIDLTGASFAATVSLGVHNVLSTERTRAQLETYDGWTIGVSEYAGFSGPFNALDTLRSGETLVIDEGSHPHCAGPALDPPEGLEEATRVHAQPKNIDSCIAWFSVDLWIVDGSIEAVTLELFGP